MFKTGDRVKANTKTGVCAPFIKVGTTGTVSRAEGSRLYTVTCDDGSGAGSWGLESSWDLAVSNKFKINKSYRNSMGVVGECVGFIDDLPILKDKRSYWVISVEGQWDYQLFVEPRTVTKWVAVLDNPLTGSLFFSELSFKNRDAAVAWYGDAAFDYIEVTYTEKK